MAINRPPQVKTSHLDFLDNLRDSGVTNMFGAAPYLMEAYPTLSRNDAKNVVLYWMTTYDHWLATGER